MAGIGGTGLQRIRFLDQRVSIGARFTIAPGATSSSPSSPGSSAKGDYAAASQLAEQRGDVGDLIGPEGEVGVRDALEQPGTLLLRHATADGQQLPSR